MTKWRVLLAAIVCITAFTFGMWLVSLAAILMNQFSILGGLLLLVVGIGLSAMTAGWAFEKLLFWRT